MWAAFSSIDAVVIKIIDETLAAVFGVTVRDNVYRALLTQFSVRPEEVPGQLDAFQTLLEKGFGPRAARVLSRGIAKRLYSELHLTFVENPTFELPEYVEQAKSRVSRGRESG